MPVTELRPAYDLANPTTMALDLARATPKEVIAIQQVINDKIRTNPDLGPLPVHEGWNDITPAIATNLLLRNPPGANRWLNGTKALYFAGQMAKNDWKPTGQPMLIDTNEKLADAQHRLYGVVVSGATIKSYVVTGVEPGLFAYIDNTTGRSAKDALQTAGINGTAGIVVNTVKFAEEVRLGKYNRGGTSKVGPFTPADIVRITRNYPNIEKAARSAASDWKDVCSLLSKRKPIVAYVGMRIMDLHDDEMADEFFTAIMETGEDGNDYANALHREVERDKRVTEPMKRNNTAAMLIKVFNAWYRQESLGRRWMPQINEDFPELEEPVPETQAAE